ncbi:MAG TPA: glycosyltransferase family 39 protein [Candidatus Limnocylindria bacterium]|nr:glycosyltransferase family 39 protein [Candidatus Limnocylindria bacterium]
MAWLADDERRLVWMTLAVKIALLAIGAWAYVLFRQHVFDDPRDLLAMWSRWDAPHYLDIVVFGYRAVDDGSLIGPNGYRSVYPGDLPLYIVFYPLYPWLSTAVNALVGDPLVSAFVVTTAASLFVAPLLYRLVRHDEEAGVAMRAAWFLLIFPTAYFLHIGYTEALFMALVLGSFLAARIERWWLAGLLGGLAALTRVNGLILVPALAAEAFMQWLARPPGERRLRVEWLAIGLVGVGFGIYLGLNLAVYGNPLEFLRIQDDHWFKSLAPPWEGIGGIFDWIGNQDADNALMLGWMELLFVAIGLAGTIHAAFRFRPSWFAWMAGNWLLFVSTAFVVSVPRYALTLFPLYVSLAVLSRRTLVLVALSAVSIAGLVYFTGRFATGVWAF